MYTVERYRKTRFWAVYEAGELVCVTVYKRGANVVKERLERQDMREPETDGIEIAAPN